MISIILLALAAIANATMDILREKFHLSIFKNLDPKFWNPNISWNTAPKILNTSCDGWHISKMIMILSICAAIYFAKPTIYYLALPLVWGGIFELCYSFILKSKK